MIITLLSDLGLKDTSVGLARAVLMLHAPDASVVDMSHCVARDDIQQAAYLLLSGYRSFEKGSVHIAAVDVFAGASPRMVMVKKEGHFFIGPDNGLLSIAFEEEIGNLRLCAEFKKPYSFGDWMDNAARVATTIAQGWVMPYPKINAMPTRPPRRHQVMPYGLECNVLYIDRYRNVVLDITKRQFEKIAAGRPFAIRIMKQPDVTTISNHYNEVPEGQPLCRFNTAGYLEIAMNRGDVASHLGLDPSDPGDLKYKVVRIFF